MMEYHLKTISLHLSNCWSLCQYSFPVVCWLVSYRVPYARSDPTATEMQIERSSRCEQLHANWNCHRSLQGTWAGLAVATRQVYLWTEDSQFGFMQVLGTKMAIFALKHTVDFYHNQETTVYMCFLDLKKVFARVNHWTLAKKQLDRNVPWHIAKLFIFWYREQEFMVCWGNSLSMTFRCANGIRQEGQLSKLL